MAVWAVTGKLGAGKGIVAVGRIRDYLNQGRRIATNFDLNLEKLVNPFAKKTTVYRTSDLPTIVDLEGIGLGYDGDFVGDDKNGLIVFDECAKWLNTRDFRDKNRKALVDWMIHARKYRWDIIFVIQDIEAMDKQFRDLFCEHIVYCRRLDRYNIPFLSPIYKFFTGKPLKNIRMHVGIVKYGSGESAPVVDRWWYRGNDLFDAYDTEQVFGGNDCCLNMYLSPYLVWGRYHTAWDSFKDDFKTWPSYPFLISGVVLGGILTNWLTPDPYDISNGAFVCNEAWSKSIGCEIKPHQLKDILSKHSKSVPTSDAADLSAQEEVGKDFSFDLVFIDSFYQTQPHTFNHSFVMNGESFNPKSYGYDVHSISECEAILIKSNTNEKRHVFCQTFADI